MMGTLFLCPWELVYGGGCSYHCTISNSEKTLLEDADKAGIKRNLDKIEAFLESQRTAIEEYDENLVRRLIQRVTVYDKSLTFQFKSGIEINITM